MEILRPTRQKAWGWPAAVNFILGGMGSGVYLLSLLTLFSSGGGSPPEQAAAFKTVGPALTILGLAALAVEAGRPLRSRYLLSRLKSSWMSRETLTGALFVACALLDRLFPSQLLQLLAAAAAAGFLLSQGFLVYRAGSVIAWNVPLVPLLFFSSGLATGGGVLLLSAVWEGALPGPRALPLVLACMGLDLAVWLLYIFGPRKGAFYRTTRALRSSGSLVLTAGIGHILPALLLLPAMAVPAAPAGLPGTLLTLAGLAAVAGGAALKAGIILQAGFLRGIYFEDRGTALDPPGQASQKGVQK